MIIPLVCAIPTIHIKEHFPISSLMYDVNMISIESEDEP